MGDRTRKIADILAADARISDYDMWRELKTIDLQLYDIDRNNKVVPISLLYRRRVLVMAFSRRSRCAWD